ncbi:MAG: metallophosphoesterase family protein [Lachnospiraceae bacterium]|nr:metallophosphoesterase family protein [Lachnospiraceae bacterium]
MEKRIKNLVDLYFEDVPYSLEVIKAREVIEAALFGEYRRFLKEHPEGEAFEEVVESYGKLSCMAELVGYKEEDAVRWRKGGTVKEFSLVRKETKRQRRRVYGISFLSAALLGEVFWLVYDLVTASFAAIFVLAYGALLAGGAALLYRRFKRLEREYETTSYDTRSYLYFRTMADRYGKRRLNGIALFTALLTIFLMVEFSFFIFGNSKAAELLENLFSNMLLFEIPVYLAVKNYLCFRLVQDRIKFPDGEIYRKHRKGMIIFSVIYWVSAVALTAAARRWTTFSVHVLLAEGVLFAVLILFYNLGLRKEISYRNFVVNTRRAAAIFCGVLLVLGYGFLQRDTWYTQPYINSLPVVPHDEHKISYHEETGVYTITADKEDFKILHLTDIHLGGSLYSYRKDMKALKAVYAELEYARPDLVVVTGDMSFPLGVMSLSFNNSAPVGQFAAFMRNVDIPWAFTYGNHDAEGIATLSEGDLNELYKSLSYKTSGNLLYPYIQPEITGRNNQLIEIRNPDGTLNQALFLIDSNAYTGEGLNAYDYIHDDQVDWYEREVKRLNEEEGHTVSSMAFFHIPLQEYRTAYKLYEAGSDEVAYFFGENNEKAADKVCCSDSPSKLFDTMVSLGSTKAVFCGHDHYNNMSLEYRGIRLTYGMSIDYLAMPGIERDETQRGAELITLHPDSTWELTQIPLSKITQ